MREGLSSTGLCGLVNTAYPTCPERWAVAANAGYGTTESVGATDGAHHRLYGSLGAGVVPLRWLALSLRLDGRLDLHPRDDRGKDLTGTGDPRLFVRGGYELPRDASIGMEAVLWFPGNVAPSYEPKATSLDLKALAAWTPKKLPLALLGHVGYRLDQSASSAPDLRRLRAGDRLALGLSGFDAVLVGVGASTRLLDRTELFLEASLDVLVGQDAPALKESPMRVTAGGRWFIRPGLQGELSTTFALSARPQIEVSSPLIPVEPRFSMAVGLRYGRLLHPPPRAEADASREALDEPAAGPGGPRTTVVSGVLVDAEGEALPDVRVVLTVPPETQLRETVTDGEGKYVFADVPMGDATLEASAPGFETQQWILEVSPRMAEAETRTLARKGNLGTLRLLTRTFSSEPLAAAIVVRDARGRKVGAGKGDAQGKFEIDLPPGVYTVMISATGYRPLKREVRVERWGVAILNVDMREQK